MKKVITYGTYDKLHHGHIRLLERARALGDYLIVGVTSDDFDRQRGKINVVQSLMERIANVEATGLADEIIIEEYQGQKIDDIRRYGVDIFTVGSDWVGKFDYLREWCEVVYLPRTEGVSSTQIRSEEGRLRLGVIGASPYATKVVEQSAFVNGIEVTATRASLDADDDAFFDAVDAAFVLSLPAKHYHDVKVSLSHGKHVLCESPAALSRKQAEELWDQAKQESLCLVDAVKTAYATAYERLLLLVKSGAIGEVVSVDATCTALRPEQLATQEAREQSWSSMCSWGPTALLPVFHLLGTDYKHCRAFSKIIDETLHFDAFSKVDFEYADAVASIKVAKGAKSEGELVVTGTEGYVYVPAPWWKTDYFEVRFEDSAANRRYFYQLDGEGIRYELVSFLRTVKHGGECPYMSSHTSLAIVDVIESLYGED